jgi:hypothetical protein
MKERLMLMGRIAVHDLKSYFVSPIGYVVWRCSLFWKGGSFLTM